MSLFRYTALDAARKLVSGSVEAESLDQARDELASRGLQVQSIEPVPESARPASEPHLSPGQRGELSRYLASFVGAGIPLGPALRSLAEEMGTGRLAKGLRRLADRIDRGQSPEQALRALDPATATLLEGLIAAGGRTGRLAELLNELVASEAVERQLRWRAWMSLLYPTLIVVAAVLLFCTAFAVGIRGIGRLYDEFDMDLPQVTLAILTLSRPVVGNTVMLAAAVLGALVILLPTRVFPGSDDLLIHLPGLRRLYRSILYYRLTRLLGVLLAGQTTLPEAFRLAASAVSSRRLARQCRKAMALAQSGRSLTESLQEAGLGPVAVALGNPAHLPADPHPLFLTAAESFESRARMATQIVETFYPPLVFVGIWFAFSVIVPALFLPLIGVISALS